MANNFDAIKDLVQIQGNKMGLSNSIFRDYGIPLDYTSVQETYEAAVIYAATSTKAYVGQPLAVGDTLYIITDESQGHYPAEVVEGQTQYEVYLKEVGSKTEGDGKSIELTEGILSISGFKAAADATLPQKNSDGSISWVTIDAIVQGDGNTKSVVAVADGSKLTVNKVHNEETDTYTYTLDVTIPETDLSDYYTKTEVDALVKGVSDKIGTTSDSSETATVYGAIAKALKEAKEYADANDTDTVYDDTQVRTDIKANSDAIDALETAVSNVYTKTEVDNKFTAVNESIANITHFTTSVVTSIDDVTSEGVLYLIKDETVTGVDKYNEYLFIGGEAVLIGDTTTNLNNYVTNEALATAIANFVTNESLATTLASYAKTTDVNTELDKKLDKDTYDTDKATFALKGDVETALSGKVDTTTLESYYTKTEVEDKGYAVSSDVETELAKKIESGSITHTSEGVSEGVTKEGTNLKIVVDTYTKEQVYTKSETDAAITAKINSVTGGESAADVKLALEDYRTALNTEIWGSSAAGWTTTEEVDGKTVITYTPQYGTTSRVDTLESKVGTLETNVTKAQETADGAAAAIVTLENGQVKTNKDQIAAILTRVETVESQSATNKTDISTLSGTVNGINTVVEGHTSKITGIEASITTLTNKDTELDTAIKANATEIAKKANSADVYTKTEIDTTIETVNTNIGKKADATNVYTKTEVDNLLSNLDQSEILADIEANATAIATLNGEDTGKSVRVIAKEEVAAVVDGAPAAFDTLKEIAAWIENDETGAAALSTKVAEHDAALAGIGGADEPATVVAAIDAAIDAIPEFVLEAATTDKLGGIKSSSGDNKITVGEDGVASVTSVNVNTLTQTNGDVLILNGGTATI